MNAYIEDKKKELKDLQDWRKKVQKKDPPKTNPKNFPKTVE
jgi:hypothetical protein